MKWRNENYNTYKPVYKMVCEYKCRPKILGLDLVFLIHICMQMGCTYKLKLLWLALVCCSFTRISFAQMPGPSTGATLQIKFVDKDSSFNAQALKLQLAFNSQPAAIEYVNRL